MPETSPERYQIIEVLGRGGMGGVYRAFDKKLGRVVAIKVVEGGSDPSFATRLEQEARATALLSHPNIVSVYDIERTGDSAFIVMEYVAGRTLERRMHEVPSSEWRQFLPGLKPCAEALDFAHRKGIVHRDIKPSNIMWPDAGQPKVLDFGIARIAAIREARITQAGTLIGTPMYMAPEQIQGGKVCPQTDQYALAVIAYTLLVGRRPYDGTETVALIYQITQQPPAAPSTVKAGLPRKCDEVLVRALAKEPGQRFATCTEFFDELERSLATPAVRAPGSSNFLGNIFESIGQLFNANPARGKIPANPNSEELSGNGPPISPPGLENVPLPPAPSKELNEFTQFYRESKQTVLLRKAPEERVDPDTIARAQARELIEILERRDFESAIGLRGKWLPGIEGAPGELISFSEAARYLGAAETAMSPHIRIEHLKRAEKVLFSAGNQLLADTNSGSRYFPEALEAWKSYARELLASAREKQASELPNPFRAGQPLRPDQGQSVFRGRTALIRNIEAILADADQNSSLALLGPRRCGKTSLLQMLPVMLPDCACVFFDLQDNAVSTVADFFEALSRRAREQIRIQRRLDIPALEEGGAFESATRWLDRLDDMTEVNRILISIDEFERLEDLFPGDRRDLLRLMGLFRATIQHRRKVRLLVSGVAPFEELGPLWNDHFINVRELRIGHLDEQTAIDLLCKPIAEFPENAVPIEVARRIFERTGGQPYLLQLFGALLVNRLNEEGRSRARMEDVAAIEEEALSQGRYYFDNTYRDAKPEAREILEMLARGGEKPIITKPVRRWLERRCLLDEKGELQTPVLGAYIRDELGV